MPELPWYQRFWNWLKNLLEGGADAASLGAAEVCPLANQVQQVQWCFQANAVMGADGPNAIIDPLYNGLESMCHASMNGWNLKETWRQLTPAEQQAINRYEGKSDSGWRAP